MAQKTMTTNTLQELQAQGQSVWYDNIQRGLITSGALQKLIDDGVTGITSNPTIFEKAISSSDYDDALVQESAKGSDAKTAFEAFALDDIGHAADLLRPVYDRTSGADGFISIEVSPSLAHDTKATIAEAHHLWSKLDRPNIMIKVPAAPEGLPAIRKLISEGINVNVTMIFGTENYCDVAEAYLAGLEDRAAAGGDLSHIASVASIFVSRIDTAVDKLLDEKIAAASDEGTKERLRALQGKAAIANAKDCYQLFEELYSSERFAPLKAKGAKPQRLLWASTSTKNPAYSDVLYVEALIGPQTVDTMPPQTVDAFKDHGTVHQTLTEGYDKAQQELADLEAAGIDMPTILQKLQDDGIAAFAKSYDSMLGAIKKKLHELK